MKKGENKMSFWEKMAKYLEDEYGTFVDWDEEFFICAECGEPIYKVDWEDEELLACPVCEFCW